MEEQFDWNSSYEYFADLFYKKHLMLAPGKDESPAMYSGEEHEEERRRLWDEFMTPIREQAWRGWHEKHGMLKESNV